MHLLAISTSLVLLPLVIAQNVSFPLQIEAIEAHFQNSGIVPSLLATFTPTALLTLSFGGVGNVQPGQSLTEAQVSSAPTLTVTSGTSSLSGSSKYTFAMVDAGPVGTNEATGQTRHWLVNNATISNSVVSNATATAITKYAGPAPPAGSGPHRYVVLLYTQPSPFNPPAAFSKPDIGVALFDFNQYVKNSSLTLVAGTYITVGSGKTTASLSATSAVVTSTLPVPSSTSSSPSATATHKSGGALSTKTTGIWIIALASIFILACA